MDLLCRIRHVAYSKISPAIFVVVIASLAMPAFLVVSTLSSVLIADVVHIDDFGGNTHAKLSLAVSAAGDGGTVLFSSGQVYNLDRAVSIDGQTWTSDGAEPAVIRRNDAVVTALAQAVLEGSSIIEVSDASGLSVGNEISPIRPGGIGGRADTVRLLTRITQINGNTLESWN